MKTTVDIPDDVLEEAMKSIGARTKREAILTALQKLNRLKKLEKLNSRVRGKFRQFMTLSDLQAMRAADTAKLKR